MTVQLFSISVATRLYTSIAIGLRTRTRLYTCQPSLFRRDSHDFRPFVPLSRFDMVLSRFFCELIQFVGKGRYNVYYDVIVQHAHCSEGTLKRAETASERAPTK